MTAPDLTDVAAHFKFGENWRSFVDTVTRDNIEEAKKSLARLFPDGALEGRSFLDIGCGSGLSMLAAAELGAGRLSGVDIDPASVGAAEALLARYRPGGSYTARVRSVFDLDPAHDGLHDIVHSWGVLHHTGDMVRAIERASRLVAPGGMFALALYRKTPLCGFWRWEKRLYTNGGRPVQAVIQAVFKLLYRLGLVARRRSPAAYIAGYKTARGMDWHHDVHDWLGGYPYESVTPAELSALLDRLGFRIVRQFEKPAILAGLFGSHCDEFVAVRK
jgi:2-polyprenyl-6-hydroxyphenyl methylase/3-demethylubiquinone-9 3-methyltransferase